jgi:ADP-ribosylglycohydrolase
VIHLSKKITKNKTARISSALKMLFIADALSMPVHWFYNTHDIFQTFPNGITQMEPAPDYHPSSIMSFHSMSHGGRKNPSKAQGQYQIVGEVILKGRASLWHQENIHYHHQMKAGENTLNAYCVRVMINTLKETGGIYDKSLFLDNYISFMTSEDPQHPDTYAESYHRGFFSNWVAGRPKELCGAITHDTPSIGGFLTIAPIVFSERLRGTSLDRVQLICRDHLYLTHPDEELARICFYFVELIDTLLFLDAGQKNPLQLIHDIAVRSVQLDLSKLVKTTTSDSKVVGNTYSNACYISESWPSLLYITYKYLDDPRKALLVNANLGGDNVHRGAIIGILLGLAHGSFLADFFSKLVLHKLLDQEIDDFMTAILPIKV